MLPEKRSGDFARAPWYVIPGRGLPQFNGQWESSSPATRAPLGAALLVPRRPRNRMGFRGAACKHARHQHQRNVYRSGRSALGGCILHRATDSRSPRKTRVSCKARGAWTWHGRVRGCFRIREPEALRGPAFFALQHRLLIPFYTKYDDTLP